MLQVTLNLSKSNKLFEVRPGTKFHIVMERVGNKWREGNPDHLFQKVRNDGTCVNLTTGADAMLLNNTIIITTG